MKIKMQIIFKTGNSMQGETYPDNFQEFVKRVNECKSHAKKDAEPIFFEIFDETDGKAHAIMVDLKDVTAFIFEEIPEPVEVEKLEEIEPAVV